MVIACCAALCFCAAAATSFGTETNSAATDKSQAHDDNAFWAQHVVESYQQMQEQQQSMVQEMEKARQEAQEAAKRNNEQMESRLSRIEQSVSADHQHEIDAMQNSHRMTLIVVGTVAGIGLLAILIFAVFVLRSANRRTDALITQFAGHAFVSGFGRAALGPGDTQVVTVNRVEQSTARFVHSIEQLEKRINELEGSSTLAEPAARKPTDPSSDTIEMEEHKPAAEMDSAAARAKAEQAERDGRIALLLGKGQALLNLHQADTALTCFDEVIALDSTNPEAFVKKGMALERLGKLDEAIECYDRAIALDNSMTMAYLSKGGVFNRQERYGEALQCYEQALRAQQKPSVA